MIKPDTVYYEVYVKNGYTVVKNITFSDKDKFHAFIQKYCTLDDYNTVLCWDRGIQTGTTTLSLKNFTIQKYYSAVTDGIMSNKQILEAVRTAMTCRATMNIIVYKKGCWEISLESNEYAHLRIWVSADYSSSTGKYHSSIVNFRRVGNETIAVSDFNIAVDVKRKLMAICDTLVNTNLYKLS